MNVKPEWLKRLHVTAIHPYPQKDCPLCKKASERMTANDQK